MKKKETISQVLYRKYRPETFADVVGEEHIVSVLENQIKLGTMAHAYLFAGSRGTGKTSVARIFAREVGTSSNDLYEIDAASNTGVDDMRALNESVTTLPFESKYKVYILDEAHMLSKSAWNAFLKTLEEPPEHVIFILATTELEKVPETILSRCQIYIFKKPSQSILREFAETVGSKEGRSIQPEALELIAILGDGSFRDTHGILEKLFSSTKDKKITREAVESVTGAPKQILINNVLEAIVDQDAERGLKAVAGARESNADMKIFAHLILERLRFLFLLRLKAGMDEYIVRETSADDAAFLKALSERAGASLTAATLLAFIEALETADRTAIPGLSLEIALANSIK
ncbi:DNA polymerase III subunit gamma/tau [Candidatus Parcubacteria bacterium]|nr:DNA polymerase III subunit gamma/tau [Candidatus Parcubacteria bacterium]